MRRLIWWGPVVLAAAFMFAAVAQARARPGRVPDRGAHVARIRRAPDAYQATVTYGGGPVLHWNRTHVIVWQPAGSGLSFEPGYESLVVSFLRNVATASHSGTN